MKHLKLRRCDVSVALVSDRTIQALNRKYRRIDRPTDVLSFSQDERSRRSRRLLGDIVISVPTALRQARLAHRPIQDELEMLAVHGLLHLLGYDHATRKDEKKMFSLQHRLLTKGIHAI